MAAITPVTYPRAPVMSQISNTGIHNVKFKHRSCIIQRLRRRCIAFSSPTQGDQHGEDAVDDLKLPIEWSNSAIAAQESEWLRGALKTWLDEEYYPEDANVEISKRCAAAYYRCLVEQELDAGNILLQMIQNLETFSFKESFHGAFSSANAAMELIVKRMNLN